MKLHHLPALLLAAALAGCATPTLTLKNDKTGQVVQCGGDVSGSLMGGMIGYNAQKNSDESCAKNYEAQGFRRVQ
jgi:hypothetical protein